MKIRVITATFIYCNSGRREEETVNVVFTDESEKYTLTKLYVIEKQQSFCFDKSTNEFLVND